MKFKNVEDAIEELGVQYFDDAEDGLKQSQIRKVKNTFKDIDPSLVGAELLAVDSYSYNGEWNVFQSQVMKSKIRFAQIEDGEETMIVLTYEDFEKLAMSGVLESKSKGAKLFPSINEWLNQKRGR